MHAFIIYWPSRTGSGFYLPCQNEQKKKKCKINANFESPRNNRPIICCDQQLLEIWQKELATVQFSIEEH